MNTTEIESIPLKKLEKIIGDPVKSAEAINLVYVNDAEPGIQRIKKGRSFAYIFRDKPLKDEKQIQRIQSLVLPPAWENVWICFLPNGHLQATGTDAKNRKQYRYHNLWNSLRNHTKFYRMLEFGKALPGIRLRLEKDLSKAGLSQEKVLAAIVMLMERTNIRVGNNIYEKLYGSFGLTTLKDKHVDIKGSSIRFSFKGKKGIEHDIALKNRKLAKIVQNCKDIPGKELFQYYDQDGNRHGVDSGMVNAYIKEISGEDFTAKDFRTWAGTVNAFLAFKELGNGDSETEQKKNLVAAIDRVAKELGNTRAVCKKYYVHPLLISLYESKSLNKYFEDLDEINKDDNKADLTNDEKIVMKILEHH